MTFQDLMNELQALMQKETIDMQDLQSVLMKVHVLAQQNSLLVTENANLTARLADLKTALDAIAAVNRK